jgi:hypothetical protein
MDEKSKNIGRKTSTEMGSLNNDSNFLLLSRPENLLRESSPQNVSQKLNKKIYEKCDENPETYPRGSNTKIFEEDSSNKSEVKEDKRLLLRKDKIVIKTN